MLQHQYLHEDTLKSLNFQSYEIQIITKHLYCFKISTKQQLYLNILLIIRLALYAHNCPSYSIDIQVQYFFQ